MDNVSIDMVMFAHMTGKHYHKTLCRELANTRCGIYNTPRTTSNRGEARFISENQAVTGFQTPNLEHVKEKRGKG